MMKEFLTTLPSGFRNDKWNLKTMRHAKLWSSLSPLSNQLQQASPFPTTPRTQSSRPSELLR